jgi:hypothetical protein
LVIGGGVAKSPQFATLRESLQISNTVSYIE